MRKPRRVRSLAEQIADLDDPAPKYFDPEAQDALASDGASDSETSNNDDADLGREHYEVVGKSKLRKTEKPALGPRYQGSRVSRDALGAQESDDGDPFAPRKESPNASESAESVDDRQLGEVAEGEDEEIENDEAFGESDIQRFKSSKFSGSKSVRASAHERRGAPSESEDVAGEAESVEDIDGMVDEESADVSTGSTGEGAETEREDFDMDDTASEKESSQTPSESAEDAMRAEIRKLTTVDHEKSIATQLSSGVRDDAAKGQAIMKQRITFDVLLNTRIQLQKGLSAMNSFAPAESDSGDAARQEDLSTFSEAAKAAEKAAFQLWSNLETFRHASAAGQGHDESSKKRKRDDSSPCIIASADMWAQMEDLEKGAIPRRRKILDKWSSRANTPSAVARATAKSHLFNGPGKQQSLTSVIDSHLARDIGSSDGVEHYDDTIFYQTLLRELVDQKMSSNASSGGSIVLPSTMKLHPKVPGSKEKIDTRASKGRKVRYTVHEKMQNFMAEENRGRWEERSRREFFGSLLGQKGLLQEDEMAAEGSDEDVVEGGLKLFRG